MPEADPLNKFEEMAIIPRITIKITKRFTAIIVFITLLSINIKE
jgi:hypothetical protein